MKKSNKKDILVREYSDSVLPKFLSDPDWFLKKYESRISKQSLEDESDSEKKQMFNMDDMEEQNTKALQISIKNLSTHMEIINEYLRKIKEIYRDPKGDRTTRNKQPRDWQNNSLNDCIGTITQSLGSQRRNVVTVLLNNKL